MSKKGVVDGPSRAYLLASKLKRDAKRSMLLFLSLTSCVPCVKGLCCYCSDRGRRVGDTLGWSMAPTLCCGPFAPHSAGGFFFSLSLFTSKRIFLLFKFSYTHHPCVRKKETHINSHWSPFSRPATQRAIHDRCDTSKEQEVRKERKKNLVVYLLISMTFI